MDNIYQFTLRAWYMKKKVDSFHSCLLVLRFVSYLSMTGLFFASRIVTFWFSLYARLYKKNQVFCRTSYCNTSAQHPNMYGNAFRLDRSIVRCCGAECVFVCSRHQPLHMCQYGTHIFVGSFELIRDYRKRGMYVDIFEKNSHLIPFIEHL